MKPKGIIAILALFVAMFGYEIVDKNYAADTEAKIEQYESELSSLYNISREYASHSCFENKNAADSQDISNVNPTKIATDTDALYSGYCGDKATWRFFSNGELVIEGSGPLYDNPSFKKDETKDAIKKVTVGNGITTIGSYFFSGCTQIQSIKLPDSIEGLGYGAFKGLAIKEITIPDSVKNIGYWVFEDCKNLESLTITDGIDWLSPYFLAGCSSLKSVYIGKNVETIKENCFDGCVSLDNVVIPDSVTAIGSYAFFNCESLHNIVIGKNVSNVAPNAFAGCYNLTSVTYHGTEADWNKINFNDSNGMLTSCAIVFDP